jgi:hypothetical protein
MLLVWFFTRGGNVSEYQNNAVNLAIRLRGESEALDRDKLRHEFLDAASRLYQALGRSHPGMDGLFDAVRIDRPDDIADCIAEVMRALAAISHCNDLDMMQAAYNLLDREEATCAKLVMGGEPV